MRKIEFKLNLSFFIRTILCLFFITANCMINKSYSQSNRNYILKMEGRILYNNIVNPMLHSITYLSGNYIFEDIARLQIRRYANMDTNGNLTSEADLPTTYKDSLVNYLLTDLKLKHCVEFNLSDTPTVINTYSLSKKKTGLLLNDNIELIPRYAKETQSVFLFKDTTLNGNKYSILQDTSSNVIYNLTYKKINFYLNRDLLDFPIHPISTILDNKFNGIVTRVECYDAQNNLFVFEWLINKEINPEQQAKIDKYVEKYKSLK